jgi:hypothetical protein
MVYSFLADVIVALHVAYVGFVVLGQLLILAGLGLRWEWVRNPWFRVAHLLAIAIVGFEAICGIDCPLTIWEDQLRLLAGQTITEGSFVGRLLHSVIFYDAQPWILDLSHIAFALLVVITFLAAPPRWRQRPLEVTSSAAHASTTS